MTNATTSAAAGPIATIFSFNEPFVYFALDGLSDDELWRAPSGHNNGLLWIAGHLAHTRATVLALLGDAIDTGWNTLFDRGAVPVDRRLYPTRDEIERVMRDVSPRLRSRLISVNDDVLARPATLEVPGTHTFADELAFFALHESYHVGQLAYVRKWLGYPGLAG